MAMNSEHKDTALAAVDLIADRSELEQVVLRGQEQERGEARARRFSATRRSARRANRLAGGRQPAGVGRCVTGFAGTPASAAAAPPEAASAPALDLEAEQDRRAAAEEASRRSSQRMKPRRNQAAEQRRNWPGQSGRARQAPGRARSPPFDGAGGRSRRRRQSRRPERSAKALRAGTA